MVDPFRKVQSGQPLMIPAAAFNSFIDAAEDYRRRQQSQFQDPQPQFRQTGIVRVKNATGVDQDRFAILGVGQPIFLPTDSPDSFRNEVALQCGVPDEDQHQGRFVVLLEPIAAQQIGAAVISGVCLVRLSVTEPSDTCAEISDGSTLQLKTGGAGSATILWKESGTGAGKWGVVRLGNVPPLIHKAEMIDRLQQGDAGPADAWLLEHNGSAWVRTNRQISLYGDQGFRGVAFGRTAAVDAGDKIDVYYSPEAGQWYGVVGGWYFHGNALTNIDRNTQGPVQLNVGAGSDLRQITVLAYSPYTAVKEHDLVAVNWNTFSAHWDIEKISEVELGCGLRWDDDDRIMIANEAIAGPGLAPYLDCALAVGAGCGITVNDNNVEVNLAEIAGPGLLASGCQMAVSAACGITVVSGGVQFKPSDVAGEGLVVGSGCKLRPNLGCGLEFANWSIQLNAAAVAGPGLEKVGNCQLGVKTDCGLAVVAEGLVFDPTDVAGPGLGLFGDCGLTVNAGCGLLIEDDLVQVNPLDLAGPGLVAETDCQLGVDTTPAGVHSFSAVTNVELSIAGCTLTLTKTITAFELVTNEAGVLIGFQVATANTVVQSVDLCGCRPEYDCGPSS